MKRRLLTLSALFAVAVLFAQQKPDARITEVFGDLSRNKGRTEFLADFVGNRTKLVEMAQTVVEKYPLLSSVPLQNKHNAALQRDAVGPAFDQAHFNVLKYRIPLSANRTLIYRIDGTDLVLIVEPQQIKKS